MFDYTKTAAELEAFGVTQPPAAAEALGILSAAREATNYVPTDDLLADYAAGKVTAKNVAQRVRETSAAATAQDNLRPTVLALEQALTRSIRQAVLADAERIITELRVSFDTAAAVVQTAGRYFGPDITRDQIAELSLEGHTARQGLDDALAALARIRALRFTLAEYGYGEQEQDASWWIATAADASDLERAQRAYHAAGDAFHRLAFEGFTLRMNTAPEAARLTAQAQRVTIERQAKAEQARLAAYRATVPDYTPAAR